MWASHKQSRLAALPVGYAKLVVSFGYTRFVSETYINVIEACSKRARASPHPNQHVQPTTLLSIHRPRSRQMASCLILHVHPLHNTHPFFAIGGPPPPPASSVQTAFTESGSSDPVGSGTRIPLPRLGLCMMHAFSITSRRRRTRKPVSPYPPAWFLCGAVGDGTTNLTPRRQACLSIMDKLDLLGRTSEMARLFGIDFFSVLSRGSQYRVEAVMLR